MEAVRAQSVSPRRFTLILLGSFAALALILSAVGIYGVVMYGVTQRTRDIGVRVALGARPGQILNLILRQGMTLAVVGLAIGIAGAMALTRVLRAQLFEVSPTDPATFAAIALTLAAVAALASWLPARRATRVDPMVALRSE
jgi:putative ABC transport system permease protein